MTRHLATLCMRGVRSGSPPARAARAAVAATWLVFLLLGAWGQAADSPPPIPQQTASPPGVCSSFRVREQDQIWLVSTRHLGCPADNFMPALAGLAI